MVDDVKKQFGTGDFVIFVAMLVLSTLIGLFFAYKDRKKSTTNNYYYAERKMTPITVGISISVTYLSAIALIAIPAEVYMIGNAYVSFALAFIPVSVISCIYLIPTYQRLRLSTLYEYLELRFNKATRMVCVAFVILSSLIYLGATVYLPALAVNAVTPISVLWSLVLTTAICTFYTTLGGMKAVIWTDVLQCFIMISGSVALFIRSVISIGGIGNLFSSLERGHRNNFGSNDYAVTSRSSGLTIFVGSFGIFMYSIGFSQPIVQRYKSCRSARHAQYAMMVFLIPSSLIMLFSIANGCAMFAYFEGCDPVKSGKIKKLDQGVPYMAVELFEDLPGLAGLFVASIFCASLSTVSSTLNSLSVLLVEDFIVFKWPNITERVKLIVAKVSVTGFGFLLFVVSFLIYTFQSNVVKMIFSLMGLFNGPLMGLFILGMFFPWANSVGAIVGSLSSLSILVWIFLGANLLKPAIVGLHVPPNSIDMCPSNVTSLETYTAAPWLNETRNQIGDRVDHWTPASVSTAPQETLYTTAQYIYSLNFQYYCLTGTLLVVIVGLIVSFITGRNKPSEMDPKLFIPLVDNKILPTRVRRFFRFGVPELEEKDSEF